MKQATPMSRMVKFADAFPVAEIVSTLSAKFSHHMEQVDATCASALAQRKLLNRVRKRNGEFNPGADAIQVMTMKVSKGLEFLVVALPGVGHMPAPGEDEKEAAWVVYVAATRATQRLVTTMSGNEAQRLVT